MSVAAASVGRRYLERLVLLGVDPADDEELRLQKVTLTIAAITVTVLSVVWVATYLALGLPVSAAIPFAYQVVSIASLAVFRPDEELPLLPIQPASSDLHPSP